MSSRFSYAIDKYEDELQDDFDPDSDYYISVAENPDELPTYILVDSEDEDNATIFSAYDIDEDGKVGVVFKRRLKYIQNRSHISNVAVELPEGSSVKSVIAEELINQYSEGDPVEDWTDLVSSDEIDVDVSTGKKNRVTLEENTEISFSNVADHDNFIVRIEQDDGGSNTVSWADDIEWLSNNDLKDDANEVTIFGFVKYDTDKYYGLKLGETQ